MKLRFLATLALFGAVFAVSSATSQPLRPHPASARGRDDVQELRLKVLKLEQRLAELEARVTRLSGRPAALDEPTTPTVDASSCDVPYVVRADGTKRFKPECL